MAEECFRHICGNSSSTQKSLYFTPIAMTSQTRTFIEMSDILSLRLECKSCHCSLLIGVNQEDGTLSTLVDKHNKVLANCPTCDATWTQFNAATGAFDSEI